MTREDASRKFEIDIGNICSSAKMTVKPGRLLSIFLTDMEKAAMVLEKAIAVDGLVDETDGS